MQATLRSALAAHGISFETLRAALRIAVTVTSPAYVAREADLESRQLQKFMDGSLKMGRQTIVKIRNWYLRYGVIFVPDVAGKLRDAVVALTEGMTNEARERAIIELLQVVQDQYVAAGRQIPSWLHQLLKEASALARSGSETLSAEGGGR
jgi:predicted oxidoreductase